MKAIMGLMIGAIALSGCSPGESRVDYRTGGGNSAQGHRFYSFVDMSEYPDLEDDMTILSERLVDILNTTLHLPELKTEKIYEFNITDLPAQDGSKLEHPTAFYTLNRLVK